MATQIVLERPSGASKWNTKKHQTSHKRPWLFKIHLNAPEHVKCSECTCDNSNLVGTHQWHLKLQRQNAHSVPYMSMTLQNAFEPQNLRRFCVYLWKRNNLTSKMKVIKRATSHTFLWRVKLYLNAPKECTWLRWNAPVMAERQNAPNEHLNESTPSVKPQIGLYCRTHL